jgi:hypothetical protein
MGTYVNIQVPSAFGHLRVDLHLAGLHKLLHCVMQFWFWGEHGMELVQVMHDFEAEDQGELSLTVGDYVVVRQVCHIINLVASLT